MATIHAFSMDDNAILTVNDDDGLILTSGVFNARFMDGEKVEVDFGEAGKVVAAVTHIDHDPAKVGRVEGQKRFLWTATFEFDPDLTER